MGKIGNWRSKLDQLELVALRWEQIDFTGGTIYINRLKSRCAARFGLGLGLYLYER